MSQDENAINKQIELDDLTCAQIELFATELAEDYSSYFKVDCLQEDRKLQDKTDHYLEILEGFCNSLESIRQDSAICLEEHLPAVIDKSRQIQKLYDEIDRIESVVGIVKRTVDEVDAKVTEAESVLKKPVIYRRLFNTLFGSSPKNYTNNAGSVLPPYVEPNIFKSTDYFIDSIETKHSEDATGSISDDPDEEIVVRSHRNKKS